MNRSDFFAMVKDVHEHPERLAEYRKTYKNVYPFSDGIFKMLMANEANLRRNRGRQSRSNRGSTELQYAFHRSTYLLYFTCHISYC